MEYQIKNKKKKIARLVNLFEILEDRFWESFYECDSEPDELRIIDNQIDELKDSIYDIIRGEV
tara:strand:+ start:153 stop:341 length:189 start_codon:yes stop_codon:yes gene_type:complete